MVKDIEKVEDEERKGVRDRQIEIEREIVSYWNGERHRERIDRLVEGKESDRQRQRRRERVRFYEKWLWMCVCVCRERERERMQECNFGKYV